MHGNKGEEERQPLVLSTEKEQSSTCRKKAPFKRRRRLDVCLRMIASATLGLGSGVCFAFSYLIRPVQMACPAWSSSSTVYGFSGAMAVSAIFGLLVPSLTAKLSARTVVVAVTLTFGLSFGLSGLGTQLCQTAGSPVITEILYVVGLSAVGLPSFWAFLFSFQLLVEVIPRRVGLAGGTFATGYTAGAQVFSQLILALTKIDGMTAGSVQFVIGIIVVLLCTLSIFFVPDKKVESGAESKSSVEAAPLQKAMPLPLLLRRCSSILTSFFLTIALALSCGVVAHLALILDALWNTDTPPRAALTGFAFAFYLAGRLTWTVASDCIGIKRICLISVALQGCTFGFLAWLSWKPPVDDWSGYLGEILIFFYLFICSVCKSNSLSIFYVMLGKENEKNALRLSSIAGGIGCFVGPLFIDAMYNAFKSYFPFYVTSSCLCLVSLIFVFAKPLT